MNVRGFAFCQIWNHFSNEGRSICLGVPWVRARNVVVHAGIVKEVTCSDEASLCIHVCFVFFFLSFHLINNFNLSPYITRLRRQSGLSLTDAVDDLIPHDEFFLFAFLSPPPSPISALMRSQTPRVHSGDDRFLFDACRFLFFSRNETACLTALPQMTNSVFILSFPPFVLFAYRVVPRLF